MVERLTAESLTPYVPRLGEAAPEGGGGDRGRHALPVMAAEVPPTRRVYVAAGRSKKGRLGPPSGRMGLPLTDLPPAPPRRCCGTPRPPSWSQWSVPPGARLPIQQAPVPAPGRRPCRRRRCRRPAAAVGSTAVPGPAAPCVQRLRRRRCRHRYGTRNGGRVSGASQRDPARDALLRRRASGSSACSAAMSCAPSRRAPASRQRASHRRSTCITPADTFPPAAPTSLAAVGSEGAINLIWEPSPGADLAGYIVLRGEAGSGEPLRRSRRRPSRRRRIATRGCAAARATCTRWSPWTPRHHRT